MAQQRLTDRTALAEAPNDSDLIHIVDVSDTTDNASGTSKKITVSDFLSAVVSAGSQPVENEYADITALLADQGNQTTTYFQYVLDASADPNIASGDAYYEKLASTTGTLATDYRLLSDTETTTILDSNSYRVFTIQNIQDDAAPTTVAGGGRVSFNYNTGTSKVTSIVFNPNYSSAITRFYEERASNTYVLRFYNRGTTQYFFTTITGWSISGSRYIVTVENTIDVSEINTGNRVELFFDIDNSGSVSSTQTEFISGFIESPADQDYKLIVKIPHGGTITETTTISASGTCTATFKINTTALGGTANSVSSSEQSQAHASANAFSADDDIVLTVSSNSSCADMSFTIKYTKTLS